MFPAYRKRPLKMAPGYEQEWHVSDYPDFMDALDVTPLGSVPGYCWGDYWITESGALQSAYCRLRADEHIIPGALQYADCRLRADGHIILGDYSLFVWRPAWYLRAAGHPRPPYVARNYWLGSTPPVGHDYSPAPPTYILPSKVRRLLAPLEKCDGPARLVAEFVLADLDTWPYEVIYELENKRHDGSFFFKKNI